MSKSQPDIRKRLVHQLRIKGKSESAAYAIATKALQKSGNLDSKGNPTAKGIARGKMTASERAKDRAAKESGHKQSDYKYNSRTNRATLKIRER